jgi:hypothetical protein
MGGFMADRHWTPVCAALLAIGSLVPVPETAFAGKFEGSATNSRFAREDASRAIPYAQLEPSLAPRVQRVVKNPSIFRRLPVQVINCDPQMYHFLINNPEVIVNIWQVMGITKVQMTRTGPISYEANDGAGASGTVHVAYSDRDTQVYYCEGIYDGSLFPKPMRAQCALLIKATYSEQPNGGYLVTTRCDAFIHLDNVGIELLAKTFQPMVNKSADVNFIETASFVSMVSRTSEQKPQGMQKFANKLQNISPEVRTQFVDVAQKVAQRKSQRQAMASASGNEPTLRAQSERR